MTKSRSAVAPLLFTSGYLLVWGGAGALTFLIGTAGGPVSDGWLEWGRAGRWVAGATLVAAAVYEFTPLKDACLGKCRSSAFCSAWRNGSSGALQMGARHGGWCVGCCWALMASLFALSVLSIVWMAFVAALIALEKTLPWPRVPASFGKRFGKLSVT